MTEPIIPKTAEPSDEMVEHVAADGTVIEVVSRARMRAETLRHRCTYVFVMRPDERLVIHQRASWKSIYAGYWDLAFGGVCGPGEEWRESAARELAEEAGLHLEDLDPSGLTDLGSLRYEADDGRIIGRAYLARSTAPLTCPDGEVVAVDELPIDALGPWLEGRDVSLDTKQAALPLLLAHLNMS